jgi:hypothetical protein
MDFTKAEYEGGAPAQRACAACQSPLVGQYWTAGDATVCGRCAEAVRAGPPSEGALLRVFKALVFGSGVGLAGAIGYALIITFLEVELALVTIFIGWMVGRAVRYGSEGRGGRGYQVMGAVLTYGWCMMAYVPTMVTELTKAAEPVSFPVAVILSPFVALIVPFTGAMGVLGTLILAFGVWRGWREPARVVVPIAGPFELAPMAVPVAAAAPVAAPEPGPDAT